MVRGGTTATVYLVILCAALATAQPGGPGGPGRPRPTPGPGGRNETRPTPGPSAIPTPAPNIGNNDGRNLVSTDANGDNYLSPVCSGGGWSINLNSSSGRKETLVHNSMASTVLFLDCFSYLRVPQPATDSCWNATQHVKIIYEAFDEETKELVFASDITDLWGASLSGAIWNVARPATMNISYWIPSNVEIPENCTAELQFSYPSTIGITTTPLVGDMGPRILDYHPHRVITKTIRTQFLFIVPKENWKNNFFYIASPAAGCWAGYDEEWDESPLTGNVPRQHPVSDSSSQYLQWFNPETEVVVSWGHAFESHGHFFLCSRPANFTSPRDSIRGVEVGFVDVFGGNPAFFTFLGQDGNTIDAGKVNTIVFEGQSLDLRPGHDSAKIVNSEVQPGNAWPTCNDPAGLGSVESADLGPGSDVGEHVTLAYFNFTVTQAGRFFVCYKRYEKEWQRVYPLEYVAPHSRQYLKNLTHLEDLYQNQTFAPQRTDYTPSPTKAIDLGDLGHWTAPPGATNAPSGSAECTSNNAFVASQHSDQCETVAIHVTNKEELTSGMFAQTLSNVLCVPEKNIYLTLPERSEDHGTWYTYLELNCPSENSCNGRSADDRYSYLTWLFRQGRTTAAANKLSDAGVVGGGCIATELRAVDPEEDDDDNEGVLLDILLVIIVIALILAVVAAVFIWKKNKEKQKNVNQAVNVPAGAAQHRSFQANPQDYGDRPLPVPPGQENDFNNIQYGDVGAGVPSSQMQGGPRTGRADVYASNDDHRTEEEDENNDALPAIEMKEPAPVPVHPGNHDV